MRKVTRCNVYYDLSLSPFYTTVNAITYYFSSALYLDKFKKKLDNYTEQINESLSNRFGLDIRDTNLAAIALYSSIEKRGFRIVSGGRELTCQNSITLGGLTPTSEK